MNRHSLNLFFRLLQGGLTNRRTSRKCSARRPAFSRTFEDLEQRVVLSITTTYAMGVVQNTTFPSGPPASQPEVTSLANGGFAVAGTNLPGTSSARIPLNVFRGNLSHAGIEVLIGSDAAMDQLSDGHLVVVREFSNSIRYSIHDDSGRTVLGDIVLVRGAASLLDVAALAGGGFWIVSQDFVGGTDFDINVIRLNNDGSSAGSFTVDRSTFQDNRPKIAALDNGGVVVAWTRTIFGTTEVWRAVYDANGGVVAAPAVFSSVGSVNRNVDVTSTPDGFAIVYEDNGWNTGAIDITMARFASSGTLLGFSEISNPTRTSDGLSDAVPTITRLANNLLVVGYDINRSRAGDTDLGIRLVDPSTGTVLASTGLTGGLTTDDFGEITIAGFASGGIQVFYTNFTKGRVEGVSFVGQRTSISNSEGDTITGDAFIDTMRGNGGSDTLLGGGNNDVLNGGDGDDTLNGGIGDDQLFGDELNDIIVGRSGADILNGGSGTDTASYEASPSRVNVNLALAVGSGGDAAGDILFNIERLIGSPFADTLTGRGSNEILNGGDGGDTLNGADGSDALLGGNGTDRLNGEDGQDNLTGGLDADQFVFTNVIHSPVGSGRDRITDFFNSSLKGADDKINVSAIDGRTGTSGVNPFTRLILNGSFTAEGQIRAFQSGANTVVEFNTTGTTGAEMQILLMNFAASTLKLSDFVVASDSSSLGANLTGIGISTIPRDSSSRLVFGSQPQLTLMSLPGTEVIRIDARSTASDKSAASANLKISAELKQRSAAMAQPQPVPDNNKDSAGQLTSLDTHFASEFPTLL